MPAPNETAPAVILAGDIGGTNTRLALFDERGALQVERKYPSGAHAGFEEILDLFLADTRGVPKSAAFGVAGPVRRGTARVTNLPWTLDAVRLARRLDLPHVRLLNDLEANAWGLAALRPSQLRDLLPGSPDAEGNRAVISAGTGLGEAGLYWDGRAHRPFATEGGHASFAPRNEPESRLLLHLRSRFGPVSWERVLSGPGLHNVFDALVALGEHGSPSPRLLEALRSTDPSAAISQAGLDGSCGVARAALGFFAAFYGAEAGNLALKLMATGGVYLGGGIAPKILPALDTPEFREAFLDKGPMRPLLETIPVRVVLFEDTALVGAARAAQAVA